MRAVSFREGRWFTDWPLAESATYKWDILVEKNPLILTIDPNFLGHPSSLRILGMSGLGCQVATCFEARKRGVMNGGSGETP